MIKNEVNGKVYIGQSEDMLKRWQQHLFNRKNSHNPELFQDMQDYGIAAFSFKMLIGHPHLTKIQLYKLENSFIKYFNAIKQGYNKIYSSYGFYDIDLKGKTTEEILEFIFSIESK